MTWTPEKIAERYGPSKEKVIAAALAVDPGPPPDKIEDMPDYMRRWCHLIRLHDIRLLDLSDAELQSAIHEM